MGKPHLSGVDIVAFSRYYLVAAYRVAPCFCAAVAAYAQQNIAGHDKTSPFFECRLYLFPAYRIGFSAVGIWRCTSLDKVDRADMQYCICRCVLVYINRTIDTFWHIFSQRDEWRDRPLKGIVQLLKGIFIGVAVILIAAIIAGVSPLKLITGLGAFAAVLMLVFKDSILGFVAGFQLAENDLVRRGDWIVLPGGMVNGVVEDITLDTVKVRNFDHTLIHCLPIHWSLRRCRIGGE